MPLMDIDRQGAAARLTVIVALVGSLTMLASCSGGSGAAVDANVDVSLNSAGNGATSLVYQGPAPTTEDIQAFKLYLWDNLASQDRCGGCHQQNGAGTSAFVRDDDINLAYAAANPLVDLAVPANSLLVSRMENGHNCWLSSNAACADIMTGFISDWAGLSASAQRSLQLTPPTFRTVADSRSFSADSSAFVQNLWQPLLRLDSDQYCSACHSEDAAVPQQPFFASSDPDVAYAAVQSKIDLDNPAQSRLVVRLRSEFHNCWSDCSANADAMEAAVTALAASNPPRQINPDWLTSGALVIERDGIITTTGTRVEDNIIARYEFKTGSGDVLFDTSGISPALHLTMTGIENLDYAWQSAWGMSFNGARAQGLTSDSAKLYDLVTATGEYSIEAWVTPANVSQDNTARIVSYSGGNNARNFTLGQTLYNYDYLSRHGGTDANGMPVLSTNDADEVLQATQQHVVISFDPINGRQIYVNGENTGVTDAVPTSGLADWDRSFAFILGDEASSDHPWQGTIRFVAVYNRALSLEQIQTNYAAGVGLKYVLLFALSEAGLVTEPDVYLKFQVEQLDNYSYLFSAPQLISLADESAAGNAPLADSVFLEGLRIGVNGREAVTGQAYARLSATVALSSPADAANLHSVGTLVPLEQGASLDEFFLTFDAIGELVYARPQVALAPAPVPADKPPVAAIGVRHFAEINQSLAALTGVATAELAPTYATLVQALPVNEAMPGFLTAHQMAISQLTVAYCQALTANPIARAVFFPAVSFDLPGLPATERDQVITPLLKRLALQTGEATPATLLTQPEPADVAQVLEQLMTVLAANGNAGSTDVVMASCAAAFGNATMLVQ